MAEMALERGLLIRALTGILLHTPDFAISSWKRKS
jgi:hypothetical protein